MSRNKNHKMPELTMDDLEQITFDAMRHCGMTPPLTAEEFARVEAELRNIKLPFGPSDPRELLKKLDRDGEYPQVLSLPVTSPESVRNLARAAREGGALSVEVEQRMADDKAKYLRNEHGDQ